MPNPRRVRREAYLPAEIPIMGESLLFIVKPIVFCLTQRRGERRGLVNEDSVPQNRDIFLFSGNHSASPLFLKSVSIIPFSPIRQAEGTPAMLMQSLCLSSRVSEDRLQAAGVDKRQVLFKMAGHQCGRRISAALFEWTSWQHDALLNT